VGLAHRAGEVRIRGWAEGSSVALADALEAVDCPELAAFIVTEIGRDGMLTGPDLEGLGSVLALTDTDVIASGGVSSVVDLRALAAVRAPARECGESSVGDAGRRLAGVIVGKAIYEGKVEVDAALRALREARSVP
jgi:phosphoribosylformimino-5-aminoimidazole carboxamide ribotide isomerase